MDFGCGCARRNFLDFSGGKRWRPRGSSYPYGGNIPWLAPSCRLGICWCRNASFCAAMFWFSEFPLSFHLFRWKRFDSKRQILVTQSISIAPYPIRKWFKPAGLAATKSPLTSDPAYFVLGKDEPCKVCVLSWSDK